MLFKDRIDAGQQLAARLLNLTDSQVIVLGLPRGGVPVAAEVARVLGAPLDIIVVRKLGVPFQPEFAMGAIGEDGVEVINPETLQLAGITSAELDATVQRERQEIARRAMRYRSGRARQPLDGRVVVIVDDGIATGSTARAACQVARALGAARVILAVPVAPRGWEARIGADADDKVSVSSPPAFFAIGQFYDDFSQTSDAEVAACLDRAVGNATLRPTANDRPGEQAATVDAVDAEVLIPAGAIGLPGHLTVPAGATGIVAFAHGSGSSRDSPRNRYVAALLNDGGLGSLLFDLLTPTEEVDRANVFDIGLLAGRLAAATSWLRSQPGTAGRLPVGYFGASTGAAAALLAAAEPGSDVAAVVSRGGRPDLAGPRLGLVRAPVLLIVGGSDEAVLALNRQAQAELNCPNELAVIPGATHLFEEPGTLAQAAMLARDWFTTQFSPPT
jgi:putative phosphoribosyl transferase